MPSPAGEQSSPLRRKKDENAIGGMHCAFPPYVLLSTYYAAVVILHDRGLSLAQFKPECSNDPNLKRFAAQQVEVRPDPALTGVQAVVEAETIEGSTIAVRCGHPRGSPENPLSRAQVEDKLRKYAKIRLAESRVEEVTGAVPAWRTWARLEH